MDESISTRTSASGGSNNEKYFNDLDSEGLSTKIISLASVISQLLREIVCDNNSRDVAAPMDCFHAKKVPSMGIEDYIKRIVKYSQLEPSTLILSIAYIDRLCDLKKYNLTFNNIHRIVLASILISIKYNEDDFYKNTQYAKIGGISLKELNNLEYEFCTLIDFSLHVDYPIYRNYEVQFLELIKTGKI
jgi:hypothetical protein